MDSIWKLIPTLGVLAVFIVLVLGLWNMMRGKNPNKSQTLMRWRVGLQFLAIILLMIFFYFFAKH